MVAVEEEKPKPFAELLEDLSSVFTSELGGQRRAAVTVDTGGAMNESVKGIHAYSKHNCRKNEKDKVGEVFCGDTNVPLMAERQPYDFSFGISQTETLRHKTSSQLT